MAKVRHKVKLLFVDILDCDHQSEQQVSNEPRHNGCTYTGVPSVIEMTLTWRSVGTNRFSNGYISSSSLQLH